MADKQEGEKTVVVEESANPQGGPSDDYKKLQKQLEKERAKNRELNQRLADASEAKAGILRVEELMMQKFSGEGEDETVNKGKVRREAESKAFGYYRELQKVVDEAGLDWEDERLAPALKAWEDGKHAESVAIAQVAVRGGTVSETAIEERVTKAVQAALRQAGMKVDTNTPSAPSAPKGVRLQDFDRLADKELIKQPRALKVEADKLLDQFFRKG